jgi:hypothetical protein
MVQENKRALEVTGLNQALVCADDVYLMGENTYLIKNNREILLQAENELICK